MCMNDVSKNIVSQCNVTVMGTKCMWIHNKLDGVIESVGFDFVSS